VGAGSSLQAGGQPWGGGEATCSGNHGGVAPSGPNQPCGAGNRAGKECPPNPVAVQSSSANVVRVASRSARNHRNVVPRHQAMAINLPAKCRAEVRTTSQQEWKAGVWQWGGYRGSGSGESMQRTSKGTRPTCSMPENANKASAACSVTKCSLSGPCVCREVVPSGRLWHGTSRSSEMPPHPGATQTRVVWGTRAEVESSA